MQGKTCTKCGEFKPRDQFRKRQGRCRPCQDEIVKANYWKNREKILARLKTPEQRAIQRERDKKRYYGDPERKQSTLVRAAAYRAKYPDRRKETNARWNATERAKALNARRAAARRARLAEATPAWANHYIIDFLYASMTYLRSEGVNVHVDHIVPLFGRNVRGLHTHTNLRLLFAPLNHRKSNKLIDLEELYHVSQSIGSR